jgi:stress response protein SCP2
MTTRRNLLTIGGGLALALAAPLAAQADVGNLSTEGQVPDTSPNTIIAESDRDRDAADYTTGQVQIYNDRDKAWYDFGFAHRGRRAEETTKELLSSLRETTPEYKFRAVISTAQLIEA